MLVLLGSDPGAQFINAFSIGLVHVNGSITTSVCFGMFDVERIENFGCEPAGRRRASRMAFLKTGGSSPQKSCRWSESRECASPLRARKE